MRDFLQLDDIDYYVANDPEESQVKELDFDNNFYEEEEEEWQ